MHITASKIYDYLKCPHRVWRDVWGPQNEKDTEANAFVQMLWDKGVSFEQEQLLFAGELVNIKNIPFDQQEEKTLEALRGGAPLIYQGVLRIDELEGIPDFLRRNPDGTYVPVDIKSGMGVEGVDDDDSGGGKLKKAYAAQLALYCDALIRLGFAHEHRGIIIDVKQHEVEYNLDLPQGVKTPETFWELYQRTKASVYALMAGDAKNTPASSSICKMCQWHDSCKKWVEKEDDLSGIFYVGRSAREPFLDAGVNTINDLCEVDIPELLERKAQDKSFLKGMGESSLRKAFRRAIILRDKKEPVLYEAIDFPVVEYELFFDIEDDPTQEFVYMHGVYERSSKGERYLDFTAQELGDEAEKETWGRFWSYIRTLPKDNYAVYYYSHHERTTYRKMREKYPDVVSESELEYFFDPARAIDLYTNVVLSKTDWPCGSYSIKALAQYLGFRWRDETPSGALSIQWFNEFIKSKDPVILERIRIYNEDDCKATMVLKDALVQMEERRK